MGINLPTSSCSRMRPNVFCACFQSFSDLVTRWKKCVAVDGDCFEGAHISIPLEDFQEPRESSKSSAED